VAIEETKVPATARVPPSASSRRSTALPAQVAADRGLDRSRPVTPLQPELGVPEGTGGATMVCSGLPATGPSLSAWKSRSHPHHGSNSSNRSIIARSRPDVTRAPSGWLLTGSGLLRWLSFCLPAPLFVGRFDAASIGTPPLTRT
jgi:hypothetical protein